MSEHLDEVIRQLAATPTDRHLGRMDAELSNDIRLRRRQVRVATALAPVSAVVVAGALAFGLAIGAVTAAAAGASHGLEGMTEAGRLAPSSLLDRP